MSHFNFDRLNLFSAPDTNRSFYNPYDNLGRIGKPMKPNREMPPIYYPFGKPGGGAPITDHNKKINTTLHGHSEVSRNNVGFSVELKSIILSFIDVKFMTT